MRTCHQGRPPLPGLAAIASWPPVSHAFRRQATDARDIHTAQATAASLSHRLSQMTPQLCRRSFRSYETPYPLAISIVGSMRHHVGVSQLRARAKVAYRTWRSQLSVLLAILRLGAAKLYISVRRKTCNVPRTSGHLRPRTIIAFCLRP